MKLILGFAGEIASGKGTAAEYVVKKYSAGSHRFSTMLRDMLDRIYLEHTRDNIQTLSTFLRQTHGEDLLAKVMFREVQDDQHDIVVVEGIRRPDDIVYLRKFPEFKFIFIDVDTRTRYERIIKRSENADDRIKTFEEFEKDQLRETEVGIKDLKKLADYVVSNNAEQEKMFQQIDEIIKQNQ